MMQPPEPSSRSFAAVPATLKKPLISLWHTNSDKTEAAYQRGDFFAKRCALMNDWATFCTTGKFETQADAEMQRIESVLRKILAEQPSGKAIDPAAVATKAMSELKRGNVVPIRGARRASK
jgi:hypothetical protein